MRFKFNIKNVNIQINFFEGKGGFFMFAPCIYIVEKEMISMGLELLEYRLFYLQIAHKRLVRN